MKRKFTVNARTAEELAEMFGLDPEEAIKDDGGTATPFTPISFTTGSLAPKNEENAATRKKPRIESDKDNVKGGQ